MKHPAVHHLVIAVLLPLFSATAHADACWDEGVFKNQTVTRAQCTENVSVNQAEFVRSYCAPRIAGDTNQKQAKCPATAKLKDGAQIASQPVAARCEGAHLSSVNGKVRVLHYGGSDFQGNRETLRDMCFLQSGKWLDGAS